MYSLVLPTDQVLSIFNNERYTFHPFSRSSPSRTEDDDWYRDMKRTFTSQSLLGAEVLPDHEYIWNPTPMFQVCRLLRTESMSFYYGYNNFVLHLSLPDLPRTIRWLESRPSAFYKVTKQIYLSQDIRRCSHKTISTRTRLLYANLETFEFEIIPRRYVHDGCVKRYVEHLVKKSKRTEFMALREEFSKSTEIERDVMVRFVECMQHGGKSKERAERERELWEVLPFAE